MNKEKLIKHYEKKLEKVRKSFCEKNTISIVDNEKYIVFAEKELEAVMNGRNW